MLKELLKQIEELNKEVKIIRTSSMIEMPQELLQFIDSQSTCILTLEVLNKATGRNYKSISTYVKILKEKIKNRRIKTTKKTNINEPVVIIEK